MNGIFTLVKGDFIKGLITAVLASVFITLYGAIRTAGFDFFTADWAMIGHDVFNVALSAFVGYMAKNFLTNNQGQVAGVIDTQK